MDPLVASTRRVIYLFGEIEADMATRALATLESMDVEEGDIRFVINSEGGDEQSGYAIFDAITMCRNRVVTHGYGSVMSIAAAVFQAGDERLMYPHASFMIHNGTVRGDEQMEQDSVIELAEQIRKDNKRYYHILAAASGLSRETVEAHCREGMCFTPEEAVANGYADGILTPTKALWAPKRARSKKRSHK